MSLCNMRRAAVRISAQYRNRYRQVVSCSQVHTHTSAISTGISISIISKRNGGIIPPCPYMQGPLKLCLSTAAIGQTFFATVDKYELTRYDGTKQEYYEVHITGRKIPVFGV